jgi:hypothetical protein
VRGELYDPRRFRPLGESSDLIILSDSDALSSKQRDSSSKSYEHRILLESLILAQDERWRRA